MSEIVYVQRTPEGALSGVFANPQPGYAEEAVASNDPTVVAYLNPPPPSPVVNPRQIRLALSAIGLRQAAEDYVNTQDINVQDYWHYSLEYHMDHPMFAAAMSALGKTSDDLQALFALAGTL